MTEETPNKKPRRKRRTKTEIAAEKAAKEVELNFGSSYEKEIDEIIEEERCIPCEEKAAEALEAAEAAIAEEVEKPTPAPLAEYVPQTGLNKLRKKLSQRKLRDEYYEETRKKK